jgi:hypothetical protein
MATYVEVKVQVPADRVGEFQKAVGPFTAGQEMPPATPGSLGTSWQQLAVPVKESSVPAFLRAFAAWLDQATAPVATQPPPDLTPATLTKLVREVLPAYEGEFLRLLSDDSGRPVGWAELKRKLALAGKPSLRRDLPKLTQACGGPQPAKFPVRQEGEGDDAVFWLPPELVDAVREAGST